MYVGAGAGAHSNMYMHKELKICNTDFLVEEWV
jgi:hypothetical protein